MTNTALSIKTILKDVAGKSFTGAGLSAVVYARYSSTNQREESITAQIRACREYAESKGWVIIKVYTDEAKSAQTDDRPHFLEMIRNIKTGAIKINFVLIHKLDRFSRNRYDSAFYKRELRKHGVRVESVLERLDDSPESIILESTLEAMAEYYSKNLAREVMKGMRENAEKAKHNGGKPPLGFSVLDGSYVINETEARIIRIIFEMHDKGLSYGKIINVLNDPENGYKTRSGRSFGKNSIYDILRNKKYAGIYIFNRAASKNLDGKRNNHQSKDQNEIYEIPGALPAIIDPEIFWRVQKKMDENKQIHNPGRQKAQVVYLLSGLIWCGDCGHRMVGTSSSYHTRVSKEFRRKHHYRCGHASRTGECKMPKIDKETIEEHVINEIKNSLLNDEVITSVSEKIFNYYLKKKKDNSGEGVYLEKEINKVSKKINNMVLAISEGGSAIKAIIDQLKNLEIQKTTLEGRLQEWQFQNEYNLISKQSITDYLLSMQAMLDSDDPLVQKQAIGKTVEKVIVNTDTIEVNLIVSVLLTGGGEPYRVKSTVDKNVILAFRHPSPPSSAMPFPRSLQTIQTAQHTGALCP